MGGELLPADQQQHRCRARRVRCRLDRRRRFLGRPRRALVDREDDVAGRRPLAAASLDGSTDATTTPLTVAASLSRSERAISGVSVWTVTPRLCRAERWPVDCCSVGGFA